MAVAIVMPRLGDFMTEGVVTEWTKTSGQQVSRDEILARIESEKVTYDLEAIGDGIFHPVVKEGDAAPVDGVIAYLLAEGEAPPEEKIETRRAQATAGPVPRRASRPRARSAPGGIIPSTPGARRLARRLKVDLAEVPATGPRGRVTESDVRAYAERGSPADAGPTSLPQPSKTTPLAGMRKVIAERMRSSLANTAQLSYFLEVDVTEAQRLREEFSRKPDRVVTVAHLLIVACAAALKREPALNSLLSEGKILDFDRIDMGVAVALEDGLVVPVLRNVGEMDIVEISNATYALATRAREGKLTSDEMMGGTFTISVLGTVDGFTPILNPGQNAILGAGCSVEKPVVREGEIVVREMMTLSLTADHQVVDGAVAARFLQSLQEALEQPEALFE